MNENIVESMTLNAQPTKSFFISMLVKDIELTRAILDLVDNSIDGARRLRPDGNYDGLHIDIVVNEGIFRITDNCGGIPIDMARNYAFRFGRPSDRVGEEYSIGLFGVGMKRAIFKFGSKFRVESYFENTHFVVEEDIEEWKDQDAWTFDFKLYEDNLEEPLPNAGTEITVTSLHESVSQDFSLELFYSRLSSELSAALQDSLTKGIVITVNGVELESRPIHLLRSDDIVPAYRLVTFQDVDSPVEVGIYVGLSEPDPKSAGWYIFCNSRLVLRADRSIATGWGEGNGRTIPSYHNTYARFRGYVFFCSADAKQLPWNTTKTGVDTDSPLYRNIRIQLIRLMRPAVDFLRNLSQEKRSAPDGLPLQTSLDATSPVELKDLVPTNRFLAPEPRMQPKVDVRTIRYAKPVEEIERVQEALGANTFKEVGEKTFEYFLEKECGG